MWLTKRLRPSIGLEMTGGQVQSGGLAVQGEREYRQPEQLFPYGFSSLTAEGEKAVLLDGICAGVSSLPDSSLEEGEVRLYSAGGAEILLKSTGDVVINGQVFPLQ